ncbi:MAG: branched-chain amino acid ABC transporter ATP-binding protein/permease [Desulfatiglandales bacterium]
MGDHPIHTESGRSGGLLLYAGIAAILAAAPLVMTATPWLRIYTMTGLYVMLAMGLNVVAGFAGILDLAYVAFFGIGGYLFAIFSFGWLGIHLPFLVTLPLAASASMAIGLLVGSTAVRLKGEHLVVVTFAFAQIFKLFVLNLDRPINITGGMHGIRALDPIRFFGSIPMSPVAYAYLIWLAAACVTIGCSRLKQSHYGLGWEAIREDEPAAESLGINTSLMRLKAFAGGAFIAGATGVLFASFQGSVFPHNFDFPQLVTVYCMLILGGLGNVKGVVLCAALLSILSEFLGRYGVYRVMLFSLTLILLIGVRPQGIMGLIGLAARKRAQGDEDGAARDAGSLRTPLEASIKNPQRAAHRRRDRIVLEINEVSLKFGGIVALEDVSFHVWEREILCIIGPNGAGKTTLLNVISGYYPASSGNIVYEGKRLSGLKPHRIAGAGIARTFQNPRLFNRMSVLENAKVARFSRTSSGVFSVLLGLPRYRREKRDTDQSAREALALFGKDLSENRLTREASSLPPGDRKRLEMARAISTAPKVLMLDEPSAGLSVGEAKKLADFIKRLRDEHGCTIIVVEHNLNLVSSISDRVIALAFGHKIAQGSYKEVVETPGIMEACFGSRLPIKGSPAPF